MSRYRSLWPLLVVLGGIAPLSTNHAQRAPDNALILELLDRVEQLEAEVRYVRGELEIQRHQVELLQQERVLSGSPSYRPEGAEASAGAAPPGPERPMGNHGEPGLAQPPATSTQPPATADRALSAQPAPNASTGSEQAEFDAALSELREGRHSEATAGFQRFLSAYPSSKLAGDAQYWLGESYYIGRNYNAAKEAFINLGLHYPQSARLPDALLKLGYIYGEQGDADRAREVLQKLVQVYPNTQAANLAERRLQSLR